MRRLILGAGAATLVALGALQTTSDSSSEATARAAAATPRPAYCPGAQRIPNRGNLRVIRSALLCLVNRERVRRGRKRLRVVRLLRAAATRHSADMVARRFFSHLTPAGGGLNSRLLRIGFRRSRNGRTAENIGWGSAGFSTPQSIFTAWMSSPRHRRIVLGKRFRRTGVGVVVGAPKRIPPTNIAATYTQVFAAP
jgi:uncharacterized protein YkwD